MLKMLKKNGMRDIRFKHDDVVQDIRQRIKDQNSKTCKDLKRVQESIQEEDIFLPDETEEK